ncbi:hypothetical protein AVEN_29793-1 [Araneus ventricosus]|uniref:Uncharacterized protein n=1 Tax=Araneus ventricosus TaxID=182803 RepID=A0A4Y2VIH1_ARAVE|nr:hypothetical protein AVEN_29793-1 [Araneus ventricosus]
MMESWSVFNRLENAHEADRAPPHVPQPNRLNGHGTKGCHPGTEPRKTELQAQCLDNCTIGTHTRCKQKIVSSDNSKQSGVTLTVT